MSICMEQADRWQGGGQGEPDPCGEAVELMWSEVGARRGHRGQRQRPALWEVKRRALCGDCSFPHLELLIALCLTFQMNNLYQPDINATEGSRA